MAIVFLMMGLPAAGKTGISEGLIERGFRRHSADEVRRRRTGSAEDHTRESEVWNVFYLELGELLARGENLIIDVTNAEKQHRVKLLEYCKDFDVDIVGFWVTTPIETALEWNQNRKSEGGRLVPIDIMHKMNAFLTENPPDISEGYSYIVKYDPSSGKSLDLDAILANHY
jgi:predicted kinase